MEHPAEIDIFAEPNPESDQWIRFLEIHGVVTPIGAPDDPCKVIAVTEDLWNLGRYAERSQSYGRAHHAARDTEQRVHGPEPKGDNPRPPAEFIEELRRRHLRERAGTIQVGNLTVPVDLGHIVARVEQARSLVVDGFTDPEGDDENYQAATLERASKFLLNAAIGFRQSGSTPPPAPLISGGPDGSIDIVWRGERRTLYINVPEEPDNVVTFFGTDQRNPHLKLRGEEDPQRSSGWLLSWLCG